MGEGLASSTSMKLIVGLGNPTQQYAYNRHNIGFMALDTIARAYKSSPWRERFSGHISQIIINGTKVLLLKPQTYMNESGRSVQAACQFYKISLSDVIVFQDELDLDPAQVRVKTGGGNAGHNGLKSTSAHIGNDYVRVRLGIGHPGDKAQVHNYVLSDFAKAEQPWVETLCAACAKHIELLLSDKPAEFMQQISKS